ncbi:hypothetical protein, partial [Xinfangfangia pollutisoli]|uniref:hypothetical protein n=1 Tax=Xinfangfangia pollutisoli TaxID=2865960 RepID=UPI001CD562DA
MTAQLASMTVDQIGRALLAEIETDSLTRLASLALRRVRAEADALVTGALGALSGSARLQAERARIAGRLAAATPPEALAAAPVAPARGPLRLIPNFASTARGGLYRDGSARGQMLDALSVMCRQAWERHQKTDPEAPFVPPFTPGQIAMACRYQALVERHAAAGIKGASAETRAMRGGGGGDFLAALLTERQEIDRIQRRIGDGTALAVRRIRPSARGAGARPIGDRALVDAVCLAGEDLSAVLRRFGWSVNGRHHDALRGALA